jgi:hypothetical protein
MKEPAYHSTCPRTVLTLTISKTRYFLKTCKKPETIPPSETFRVRGYNVTRTICSTWKWWRVLEEYIRWISCSCTIDMFKTISLPVAIEELTVVSNSFYKTTTQIFAVSGALQCIGFKPTWLSNLRRKQTFAHRTKASSRYPENINDALGYDLTDKHTTVASYGGVGSQTGGMHHGHGGKSPEEDIDTEKFFASSQND